MPNIDGIKYLLINNPNLYNKIVIRDKKQMNKHQVVENYLQKLEKVEDKCRKKRNYLYAYRNQIIDKYIIKFENVPASHYNKEAKMYLDRGYGFIDLDEDIKYEIYFHLKKEQSSSLSKWLDYLINNENEYPEWFLYLCLESITKIGNVNYNNFTFSKRKRDTIAPFIELNKEALSLTYSYIIKYFNNEEIKDDELVELVERANFNKIYFYFIRKTILARKNRNNSTEGIWTYYAKDSDPNILVNDIEGKGTGWCIAGIESAKTHLKIGEFQIYYTKDSSEEYTIPRIAIWRDNNSKILEIRGILEEQEIETELTEVLDEKLKDDISYSEYQEKLINLNRLKEIYERDTYDNLTLEELKFLYELEKPIRTFSEFKDPRIDIILNGRNKKKDISRLLNIDEEKIATKYEELLKKDIKVYIGNICSNNSRFFGKVKYLRNLDIIIGDVELFGEGIDIILPKKVIGSVIICSEFKKDKIICSEYITGCLDLTIYQFLNYLRLPSFIGTYFYYFGIENTPNVIDIPDNYYYSKIENDKARLLLRR